MRWKRAIFASSVLAGFALTGCQAPEQNRVPWWRGIPARLTALNSLEAEMWRRQHGFPGEGPPLPSQDFIGPLERPQRQVEPPMPTDEPQLESPRGKNESELKPPTNQSSQQRAKA